MSGRWFPARRRRGIQSPRLRQPGLKNEAGVFVLKIFRFIALGGMASSGTVPRLYGCCVMNYYVYIVESISGIWYYGYSADPDRRLIEHNAEHNVSTRGRGP